MWWKEHMFKLLGIVCGSVCLAWGSWAQTTQPQAEPPQSPSQIVAQAPHDSARGEAPPPAMLQGLDMEEMRVDWGQLDLSEVQQEQFLAKRREFQGEIAGLRAELNSLQQDLRAAIAKNPIDRAALDDILEKMASAKQGLSEAAVRNLLDLKGLLTPEQLEKLEEFQARVPPDLQQLKLTAEQRKAVAQLVNSALRKDRQAAGQLQMLRMELQELLFSTVEPDQARLIEVQRTITEQEMVLERARLDLFLQMREILTPEQLERYQQFRERRPREGEPPPQPDQRDR